MPDPNLARATAAYHEAIVEADIERHEQAYALASDQLGIPPCYDTDTRAHVAYVRRLNKLARRIYVRLN